MPGKVYSAEEAAALNEKLASMSAQEIINWAVEEFGGAVTFANSFGAEDMVVLDILLTASPSASVFILDTGRLPQETYDLIEKARAKYKRSFTVYAPQTSDVEKLLTESGPNSFYNCVADRKDCCRVRKTEPLSRALAGMDAWITGLRKDQAVTRTRLSHAELDHAHGGILKLNPLADWTNEQVWAYIKERDLPYNALHDCGYPSIGCAPCTRAVAEGEDIRAGRWWWEEPEHKECGLHPAQKQN